jgi:hypothetical protein
VRYSLPHMSNISRLITERDVIAKAMEAIERGADTAEALEMLRDVLTWHRVEKRGRDHLSVATVRLRAYIEQAIVELERGHNMYGLRTLRQANKASK